MPESVDVLAALIQVDRTADLAVAARRLASCGMPVFPCAPGGKRPLTRRGFLDASHDPAQVAAWWSRTSNANIGIPTGSASSVVIVDVDVHGARDGRAAWDRALKAGLVNGAGLLVRTPSGGAHAYFAATSGVEQRSWQAARAGVDFRGDGGYIIAPPSRRIIDGTVRYYEVVDIAERSVGAIDGVRLRAFLDPRPPVPRRHGGPPTVNTVRLAAWVAGRGEGERNRSLFWAACRLAETGTPPSDALNVLTPAAVQAGLSEREITTTVRSAYHATAPEVAPASQTRGADRWHARSTAPTTGAMGRAGP